MANEIDIYYGDDLDILLTVFKHNSSEPVNLTNVTAKMYVRYKTSDSLDSSFLIKQGTIIDAENGIIKFSMNYNDVANLYNVKTDIPYPTDFKIFTVDDKVYTVLRTNFRLR